MNDIGIYLQDGPFEPDLGIFNVHRTKGTNWIVYINEIYFDSYGYAPPKKLSRFIIKRNGYCLFSEQKIQSLRNERDSYCASFCLYKIYLTKVLGIDFKPAVLNFYDQNVC